MGKMIYLDNAATTKTAPEVVQAMMPYFSEYYGNPSSIYDFAGKSKEAITRGREQIAEVLGAKKEEIYFTAGGSESDNWALKAAFEAYKSKGNHIITTKIEHHAILHTCEYLEKERGAKITYLDVDENGDPHVPVDALEIIHHLFGGDGVQRSHRLVGQDDLRLRDEGPGHGGPLLLAAGDLVGVLLQQLRDA